MPIVKDEPKPRDPIPPGMHHAICYGVIDLGTQPPMPNSKYPKTERKILFLFELPEERRTFSDNGRDREVPRTLSKDFPASLYEKSGMYKFLVSWRGRQFTPEELKGFDLENVLGANLMLNIVHNERGYEKIESCGPLPKGMGKRAAENDTTLYDIEDSVPQSLPEWIRKRIAFSVEHSSAPSNGGSSHEQPPAHDDIPF